MTFKGDGPHEFLVGRRYRNHKGEYEVLAINGSQLHVRYEAGDEDQLDAVMQARIIGNIKRERLAPNPPTSKPRGIPQNARGSSKIRHNHKPPALRDYQLECFEKLHGYHAAGKNRALVSLPTGTGKTVIFAQLPKLVRNKKVLVLAHRKELLEQAQETFLAVDSTLNVQIEQAARYADQRADVVVASVQTLVRTESRLKGLIPQKFGTIIIDECHHALATSYLSVLSHFGLVPNILKTTSGRFGLEKENAIIQFSPKPEAPFLVGFTATPHRTDRIGLGWIFDDIAYSKTIKEMIEAKWLCKIRGLHIETRTDIRGVSTRTDDFVDRELSTVVNIPTRNARSVATYKDHCSDRCCLVFCVDVNHARHMTEAFVNAKIDARLVVGATPREEREQTIEAFRNGKFKVLVGVGVMTEGFDVPQISAIIMARPTMSQLLYTQMIGRGTGISDGKEDLLVIDLVDNSDRLDIASLNTLFGLQPLVRLSTPTKI